jgi:hypothetical protein
MIKVDDLVNSNQEIQTGLTELTGQELSEMNGGLIGAAVGVGAAGLAVAIGAAAPQTLPAFYVTLAQGGVLGAFQAGVTKLYEGGARGEVLRSASLAG